MTRARQNGTRFPVPCVLSGEWPFNGKETEIDGAISAWVGDAHIFRPALSESSWELPFGITGWAG